MKRLAVTVAAICAGALMSAAPALASSTTGNGALSGPHFNLNIHGVANGQGFNGNNQNDIFVPLNGSCKIDLVQSATYDFQVTQSNCLTGNASFTLPAPCAIDPTSGLCSGTTTYYSVYIRALGKPGGSSTTTTCATDPSTGETVCSIGAFVAVTTRTNGMSSFAIVTSELLFLTTCNTTTGKTTSTPIFSPNYQNYFWEYDNMGLKLAQLRFYQVPSPVPASVSC